MEIGEKGARKIRRAYNLETGIICKIKERIMEKWQCLACPYIYDPVIGDPENGISPGTGFEGLPDDWVCPVCGVPKSQFAKIIE